MATEWTEATAAGDGETACSLMTEAGQEEMRSPYAAYGKLTGEGEKSEPLAEDCEGGVAAAAEEVKGDHDPLALVFGEWTIDIDGTKAVALPKGGFCMFLEEVDERWLIERLPLPVDEDIEITGGDPCPAPGS